MTPRPRVLITGSTGNIGTMVRRVWDHDAPAGLDLAYQVRGGPVGDLAWDPMAGSDPLRDWVAQTGPLDGMVVLSGVVPARGDVSLNEPITKACLEAAQSVGVKRVLVASSSAVYGTWKNSPYDEDDTPRPTSDYGLSKLAAEAMCAPFRKDGIEVCCLRIGNVVGADALLLNARQGEVALDRFASGGYPVRSYIGPRCLADVLSRLMTHPASLPECLNIAAPIPVSMKDLAEAARLPWRAVTAPEGAQERITLDCGALANIYPFDARDADPVEMVQEWRKVRT